MRNPCKHKKPMNLAKESSGRVVFWCSDCGAVRSDMQKAKETKIGKWMSPQLALGKPLDSE